MKITYRTGFWILFVISVIGILVLGSNAIMYQALYKEAIKQGVENTMIGLEMTTACASLGNFTQEEILEATINMFILNKTKERSARE